MTQPSAFEQYAVEIINFARMHPEWTAGQIGTPLNTGLPNGTISSDQKQPLAFNLNLNIAAELHSQYMLDNNDFSHTGAGGTSAGQRMENAGYQFIGSWGWGENIGYSGTTGTLYPVQAVEDILLGLYLSPGHRENTFNDSFREIGLGVETGLFTDDGTTFNTAMLTEKFARSGSDYFVTGVVFDDNDQNGRFSYNEGVGNTQISLRNSGGSTTQFSSWSEGGFSIATASIGLIDLTFQRAGMAEATITIEMGGANAKVDLEGASSFASSVSSKLGDGATDLRLYGINDIYANGNDAANTLIGNFGDNRLFGGDGLDNLTGGDGQDTFVFLNRFHDKDQLTDFVSGQDTIEVGREGFSNDLSLGVLGADSFAFGSAASISQAQFYYDQTTGQLWFDRDGTGVQDAFTVAELGASTALERTDIQIVEGGSDDVFGIDEIQSLSPAAYMDGIRDYDGNTFSAVEGWTLQGVVDIQNDGDVEFVYSNRDLGRWATIGSDEYGIVNLGNHGQGGDTRVVGIYIDPLVESGAVEQGGPFDSQLRFQNDLLIDNLRLLGGDDYDSDGFQEIYWKTTDGTAYLRSLMHADGNIQYANYQSEQQMIDYLTQQGYDEATWGDWIV
jgi:hypothetical protein